MRQLADLFLLELPAAVVIQLSELGAAFGVALVRRRAEAFPLHYIVFKQTASHLPHEANVEQIFSRAGLLADPNLDPAHLVMLVKIGFNKAACNPSVAVIMDKYFELFRGKGNVKAEAEDE